MHSDTYPYAEPGGGVGVPGEFVFGPGRMPGVVEYVYTFDELTWHTIAADGNGAASVTFTETELLASTTTSWRTTETKPGAETVTE